MAEIFQSADQWLFYAVNHGWVNPIFDVILPFITEANNMRIPALILLGGLLIFGGKKGRICVGLLILCVAVTDPINSRFIKEWVARVRPCSALADVRLLVACGAGKSFMSSHAANIFAFAIVIRRFYPNFFPPALMFALLIALSRVYCGVHYPADVLCGAMFGASVSFLILEFSAKIFPKTALIAQE